MGHAGPHVDGMMSLPSSILSGTLDFDGGHFSTWSIGIGGAILLQPINAQRDGFCDRGSGSSGGMGVVASGG